MMAFQVKKFFFHKEADGFSILVREGASPTGAVLEDVSVTGEAFKGLVENLDLVPVEDLDEAVLGPEVEVDEGEPEPAEEPYDPPAATADAVESELATPVEERVSDPDPEDDEKEDEEDW
jgi:hypothetical protein